MGDKVSIIVTHYSSDEDRSFMLFESIMSLIKTAPNAEIIVVDNGGSEDDSRLLLKLNEQGKIACYIRNRKNLNYWGARNQALKICTGDYIVISDDDIKYEPGWLEECLEWLKRNEGKYLCSPLPPDPMNKNRDIRWAGEQDGWRLNYRAGSNSFLMSRESFEDIGFFLQDRRSGSLWTDAFCNKGYTMAMMPEPKALDLGFRKGFNFKEPIEIHNEL